MRRPGASWLGLRGLLVLAIGLVLHVAATAAAAPPVQYAYDELGRLVAVVDPEGNAAIYAYDAVGNVLSIRRVEAAAIPGPVAITAMVPDKGRAGTSVSILGKGFGAGAAQNAVAFNGVAAAVTHASGYRVVATVASGATTGPVTITTPLGSAVSPRPFRIIGTIAVAPAVATLGMGEAQQFVASEGGVDTTNVVWAVDGIVGGDPDVGTISPPGLYVAPATIAGPRTATVTATSTDDVSAVGTAVVALRPPVPVFIAAAPLGVQATAPGPRTLVAPGVGVQRAPDAGGLTVVAASIGVAQALREAFAGASPVSLSLEPLITSVSPATAARGSADVTLTLAGSGLAGMVGLELLLNGVADGAIAVADATATLDGTQATARISIAATAALGPRVVRIRTPAGTTTSVGAGGNVFTVQ